MNKIQTILEKIFHSKRRKRRLEDCKQALSAFIRLKSNTFYISTCGLCHKLNYNINSHVELQEQRPKHNYTDQSGYITCYWWNPLDRDIRIKVLENAIKKLK